MRCSMSRAMHELGRAGVLALLGAVASGVEAVPHVDGAQFDCAELEGMVLSARRLSISAVHVNPHSVERVSTNTFVAGAAFCTFLDEWPSQWRIRAKDGEVCTRLYICLPRDFYDGPLWWR